MLNQIIYYKHTENTEPGELEYLFICYLRTWTPVSDMFYSDDSRFPWLVQVVSVLWCKEQPIPEMISQAIR